MDHSKHKGGPKKLAFMATLHCLLGCGLGEVLGMVIGTALGFSDIATIILAIFIAFVFGYSFTLIPLMRHMSFRKAYPKALASDTVSITTMEIVDNLVLILIPGVLAVSVFSFYFWGSMAIALFVAFLITYPVNLYLIKRGKGHVVVHSSH